MTTLTQNLTAAGAGDVSTLKRGETLTYAATGTFTGFVTFERSRTGGASWERVQIGAVDTGITGTVKNESSGDERYRFKVLDTDGSTPVTGTVVTTRIDAADTLQEFKALDGTTPLRITDEGIETPKLTASSAVVAGLTHSGLTASEIVATNGSKALVSLPVATYPSLAQLAYVKGVTSAIQTQLNALAARLDALEA